MSAVPFLSICSGIEAASVALEPFGWRAVGFAEIDKFASAILAHHFGSNMPGEPLARNGIPNHGDFTAIDLAAVPRVDVLIGGTPCQSFSIAGKRLSLADARGNLTLAYVVLAHELARSHGLKFAWWENVPGVLNTSDNAFGCFMGALVGGDPIVLPRGGRWPDAGMVAGPRARAAWRVQDAQYFGLAQRRERVFVVAGFTDGADPAAVLFEPASLRGNHPPSREKREDIAGTLSARTRGGGGLGTDFEIDGGLICAAHGQGGAEILNDQCLTLTCNHEAPIVARVFGDIAHTLSAEGADASQDGTGRGTPVIAFDTTQITSPGNFSKPKTDDPCHPLAAAAHPPAIVYRTSGNCGAWETGDRVDALTTGTDPNSHVVAFDLRGREDGSQFEGPHETANIRASSGGSSRSYLATPYAVRRLTPVECERLQGFPDGWTAIPRGNRPCPDGPRYRVLGNSMAVPVIRKIGERMDAVLRELPA